ncbi:MAG: DUF721 domain-containing protein [Gammaproteobacteria bacterium]|nr:DUF721 domain-containing protein [Gammaproteobacteria bacterium]
MITAGLERGELAIGVRGAGWASRLRFRAEELRAGLGSARGEPIQRVRIRVLPTAG